MLVYVKEWRSILTKVDVGGSVGNLFLMTYL